MGKPDHRWMQLGETCGLSDTMDNILLDHLEYLAVVASQHGGILRMNQLSEVVHIALKTEAAKNLSSDLV